MQTQSYRRSADEEELRILRDESLRAPGGAAAHKATWRSSSRCLSGSTNLANDRLRTNQVSPPWVTPSLTSGDAMHSRRTRGQQILRRGWHIAIVALQAPQIRVLATRFYASVLMFAACGRRRLASMSEIDAAPLNWSDLAVSELVPTGTVTLLLADVEGSTRLWETQPDEMTAAFANLDRTLAEVVGIHGGVRPIEQGEGDSFVIAFGRASDAVACALDLQRAPLAPIRLRIGLHTGEVQLRDEANYIGPTINRTARLRDLAPWRTDRIIRHHNRFGLRSAPDRRMAGRTRHAPRPRSAATRTRRATLSPRHSQRVSTTAYRQSRPLP